MIVKTSKNLDIGRREDRRDPEKISEKILKLY